MRTLMMILGGLVLAAVIMAGVVLIAVLLINAYNKTEIPHDEKRPRR